MTFQEIFNEDGLYVADSFGEGFCFEIKDGNLFWKQYKEKDSLTWELHVASVNKGLFSKDYRKVFTRQSLFKNKVTKTWSEAMNEWEQSFNCKSCGYENGKEGYKYSRTVANGECWLCPECNEECLVDHIPNEDNY